MKNMFLSVVVIGALVAAGMGGTLADFSDSEEEVGDSLQAGSLDLKVNGGDDPILPYVINGVVPEKSYHFVKEVRNDGSIPGWLYVHIKNVQCLETDDKGFKPEPEIVAEQGGKVAQEIVPALGERCDMEKHIWTEVRYDGVTLWADKLDQLECLQLALGQLEECGVTHEIEIMFILQDVPEEYYTLDIFTAANDPNDKWGDWPTNCYMGDTVTFDVLYELLQVDP